MGIWHRDDGHQDGDNKEKQGTCTALKEEQHDAESVNTLKTTPRGDASDVEEATLFEEPTLTRGTLRYSESLEDSDTEDFSQSETLDLFEEALKQADRSQLTQRTREKEISADFWRS